ncbi:MAG: LamG domain-containing protein [Candidatus Melainabacteria bacterium]|nr:LamG domain-containing protein [Candidatus Melainabacteria bacterium]
MLKSLRKTLIIGGLGLISLTGNVKGQNLVAHWNFDEGEGNVVNDSTGNENNGTLNGGVSWTGDSFSGKALRFDGTGKINIPNNPSFQLTEKVSIEAWIKRENNLDGIVFSRNGPFFLGIRNNHIRGGVFNSTGNWFEIEGTNNLAVGQWYKLSIQYDGNSVKGFVNEVKDGEILQSNGVHGSTGQPPYIGYGDGGHGGQAYFNGIIDDVKIYSDIIPKTPIILKNMSKQADNFEFSFNSVPNKGYSVESSANLIDWTNVANVNGATNSFDTSVNLCNQIDDFRFYRVKSD